MWIKVTERLPKEGQYVLVYDHETDSIGVASFDGDNWFSDRSDIYDYVWVTHWQEFNSVLPDMKEIEEIYKKLVDEDIRENIEMT